MDSTQSKSNQNHVLYSADFVQPLRQILSYCEDEDLATKELVCKLFQFIAKNEWTTRANELIGKSEEVTAKKWVLTEGLEWDKAKACASPEVKEWLDAHWKPGNVTVVQALGQSWRIWAKKGVDEKLPVGDEKRVQELCLILKSQDETWKYRFYANDERSRSEKQSVGYYVSVSIPGKDFNGLQQVINDGKIIESAPIEEADLNAEIHLVSRAGDKYDEVWRNRLRLLSILAVVTTSALVFLLMRARQQMPQHLSTKV